MKAAILTDIKKIEYKNVEIPQIGKDEILIKVVETGICGSDLLTYKGAHPYKKPPIILGHEVCGVVDYVEAKVKGIKKGDKVCVESYSACGRCMYCKENRQNLCIDKQNSGSGNWQGSFAEYFKAPKNSVYKIPKNVSFSEGALVEPLAISLHALRLYSSVKRKNMVIIGSGNIGLSSLVCAKKLGVKKVLCTDISEFKGDLASKLGADSFINVSKEGLVDSVERIFKNGADVTLIAADYPQVTDEAIDITKRYGEIVMVSYFEKNLNVNWNKLIRKELTLKGSALSCKKDFLTIIKWLKNKEIHPLPMISHRFPLEKTEEAMNAMDKNSGKILLYP